MPAGLFNRAQVRLFQLTNNKIIWRNGSLVKKNNHLALITRLENKIKVEARGIQPENLIFLIHEVIETLIAESFNGVIYDFSFPCPDQKLLVPPLHQVALNGLRLSEFNLRNQTARKFINIYNFTPISLQCSKNSSTTK